MAELSTFLTNYGGFGSSFFCVMFSAEVSPALEPYRGLLQRLTFFTPLLWAEVMAIRLLRLCKPSKKSKGTDLPKSPD